MNPSETPLETYEKIEDLYNRMLKLEKEIEELLRNIHYKIEMILKPELKKKEPGFFY